MQRSFSRRAGSSCVLDDKDSKHLLFPICWLAFCVSGRQQGGRMASDLISYAPLLIVFIVTGLRLFVEKPTGAKQVSLRPWREIFRRPNH
jgi:hypothetical protein